MKTLLSILIAFTTLSLNAQINQKTIELHKRFAATPSYQLQTITIPADFRLNFLKKEKPQLIASPLFKEAFPKPSTQSIKTAFNYYNSLKKPVDLSGVLVVGYSLLNNQQFMMNMPEEPVRSAPANTKD